MPVGVTGAEHFRFDFHTDLFALMPSNALQGGCGLDLRLSDLAYSYRELIVLTNYWHTGHLQHVGARMTHMRLCLAPAGD